MLWRSNHRLTLLQFILFYFSAHWCGPCRQFTPTLRRWYQRHAAAQQLEVVFVSNDRNEADFNGYFSSMYARPPPPYPIQLKSHNSFHRPWSAPSRSEMPMLADALQLAYGLVSAIPTLLVVDAVTMDLLTSGGCPWVKKDASASAFPWRSMPSPPPDFGSGSTFFSMVAASSPSTCIHLQGAHSISLSGCRSWNRCCSICELVSSSQLLLGSVKLLLRSF